MEFELVGITFPKKISSISSAEMPVSLRVSRVTWVPKSTGLMSLREPPKFPKGVRVPFTRYASFIGPIENKRARDGQIDFFGRTGQFLLKNL